MFLKVLLLLLRLEILVKRLHASGNRIWAFLSVHVVGIDLSHGCSVLLDHAEDLLLGHSASFHYSVLEVCSGLDHLVLRACHVCLGGGSFI
jgi:uncharacterized membrane protein YhaH (DUF805 family)